MPEIWRDVVKGQLQINQKGQLRTISKRKIVAPTLGRTRSDSALLSLKEIEYVDFLTQYIIDKYYA